MKKLILVLVTASHFILIPLAYSGEWTLYHNGSYPTGYYDVSVTPSEPFETPTTQPPYIYTIPFWMTEDDYRYYGSIPPADSFSWLAYYGSGYAEAGVHLDIYDDGRWSVLCSDGPDDPYPHYEFWYDLCTSESASAEAHSTDACYWAFSGGPPCPTYHSTGSATLKIEWDLYGNAADGTVGAGTAFVYGLGTASVSIGGVGDPTNNASVEFYGEATWTESVWWTSFVPDNLTWRVGAADPIMLSWDLKPDATNNDTYRDQGSNQAIATWGKDFPDTSTNYGGSCQCHAVVESSGSDNAEWAYSYVIATVTDFTWN